jgi:flagellar hook protein FlgE
MMRSMFSGVSGLRSHQTMMDVVGNNVANVNTPGYKASQVTFQETLTQTVRGAAPGSGVIGGTNPIQIGLGTQVSTVDGIFTQGTAQTTGRLTDLMIQGDGYFILGRGAERFYTRAGGFGFDSQGYLVNGTGLMAMGWNATGGVVDTSQALQAIRIPAGQVIPPEATTSVVLGGNLSVDAATGDTVRTSITVFDSLGTARELVLTFTRNGADWEVTGDLAGVGPVTIDTGGGSNVLTFTNGQLPAGTTMSSGSASSPRRPL